MDKDNFKSYEFTFLYLINKCILLFKYININYQKEILYDIKNFINKLQEIFTHADFKSNNNKKNKILEVLIDYFEKIIDEKIYKLIDDDDKENIISEVEKTAFLKCEKYETKKGNDIKMSDIRLSDIKISDTKMSDIKMSDTKMSDIKMSDIRLNDIKMSDIRLNDIKMSDIRLNDIKMSDTKINDTKINDIKNNVYNNLNSLEDRINNKIKNIFSEIENNIKSSLKNYFDHTKTVEYDLDQKFNEKLYNNNIIIENKVKDLLKDLLNNKINITDMQYNINDLIRAQINDIYIYLDEKIKDIDSKINFNLKENMNHEIEYKIKILGNIFNENIEKIFKNLSNKITDNEHELIEMFDKKINNNSFNKNNFNIIFDKDNNEIKLIYYDDIISSTKINIKGLIGPKGPSGNKGDSGETPIIRKIQFIENDKIKFIIQEGNKIYEVISDNQVPLGPQGIQGLRGEPGKSLLDLKWDQDDVMRIDNEHKDSLIFLKSLCIGEKSHCLKDNSLSIGGGLYYQNNSVAIGPSSKTLDSESVALYGSCIGKKSFSYRADNVDENTVEFGKKDKANSNINSFNIISKEINFDCDTFRIKTNKYENTKIKELEDKIVVLEKKIVDIYKKI
jgi:hypothetical protein